jgi:hypothetical protein
VTLLVPFILSFCVLLCRKPNGLMEWEVCFEGEPTESRLVADGEGASVVYERPLEDTRCN